MTSFETESASSAEQSRSRRISAAAVTEIRRRFALGECGPALAVIFGISPAHAWAIATGRSHRDVATVDLSRRIAQRQVLRGDAHPLRRHPEHALRGSAHPMAKLTECAVVEIRDLYAHGESVRGLATSFGVSPRTIQFVVTRQHWRHI
jgi:hypothetical protein